MLMAISGKGEAKAKGAKSANRHRRLYCNARSMSQMGHSEKQVLHRRPTELGGLGKVAGAPPASPPPDSKGCETAILPRGGP